VNAAERLDLDRVVILLAELGRLTQRETEVRREIAQMLELPRSPAADAELGKLLQQFSRSQTPTPEETQR
jgi:hypothetical protein